MKTHQRSDYYWYDQIQARTIDEGGYDYLHQLMDFDQVFLETMADFIHMLDRIEEYPYFKHRLVAYLNSHVAIEF